MTARAMLYRANIGAKIIGNVNSRVSERNVALSSTGTRYISGRVSSSCFFSDFVQVFWTLLYRILIKKGLCINTHYHARAINTETFLSTICGLFGVFIAAPVSHDEDVY